MVLQQINGVLGTRASWYCYCRTIHELLFYELSRIKALSVGINDNTAGFAKCQTAALCSVQLNREENVHYETLLVHFPLMKLLRITSERVVTADKVLRWNRSISHI